MAACPIFPFGALTAQEPGAVTVLEEIVVTARRRVENLQDLPLSIAAITADTMQLQGIYNIEDIGEFVPNLEMTTSDRANTTRIFIRGIGGGGDPILPIGAGMYIDGHYIPQSAGGYMSTLDIERVEVLRGPQGTLFGKNTMGGAVNIISAKPQPDFASSLTLRGGEFGQQDVRGMLNFPISENTFARLTAAREQEDGYYYNRNLDIWTGGADLEAMSAALRFTPGDHWTIDTTLSLARQRDDNHGGQCSTGDGNVRAWGGSRWYGDTDSVMYRALCDEAASLGPFVNSSDKITFSNVDQDAAFVVAQWNSAGPVGALDSLTAKLTASYRYVSHDLLQDRDHSSFRIDAVGNFGPDLGQNTRTRNGELLLEGVVNDRLDFVVGVNYFEQITRHGNGRCYTLFVNLYDLALDNDVECRPQEGFFFELVPDKVEIRGRHFTDGPPTFFKNASVWNDSLGVFGHLTYELNDDWSLDFGARYTEDQREFNNVEFHISNYERTNDLGLGSVDLIMNYETVIENGFFNEGAATFSEVTPMISLTRRLGGGERLESGMFYLLYAEGFLTGGFNNELNTSPANPAADLLMPFQSFGPEHLDNYEVGFKGTFGDGRVRLNSALFFMDYTDIHDDITLDNSDGQFGGGDDLIGITTNIANAEIYGVELELRARLWRGSFLSFDLGYNRYKGLPYLVLDEDALEEGITRLVPVGGSTSDELNANVSLRHDFILPNGGSLSPMLGLYWVSQDPELQSISGGVTTFEYCGREGDYAKWRARLTYQPPSGNYEVSLFGNNITDELIYEHCFERRGAYNYRYERPATWGIEFSARWGS